MQTREHSNAARDKGFSRLVWAVPLTVIIHNGEEALTMPKWLVFDFAAVVHQFGLPLAHIPTQEQVDHGLFLGAAIPLLIAAVAFLSGPRSFGLYLLAGIQGIMLTNALVPHLIATILLRRYTPGAVTAIILIIPFSIFWFRRVLQRGFIELRPLIISIIGGALTYLAIMLLGLSIAAGQL